MEIKTHDASYSGQPNKVLGKDKYGLDFPKPLKDALFIVNSSMIVPEEGDTVDVPIRLPKGHWTLVACYIPGENFDTAKDDVYIDIGSDVDFKFSNARDAYEFSLFSVQDDGDEDVIRDLTNGDKVVINERKNTLGLYVQGQNFTNREVKFMMMFVRKEVADIFPHWNPNA